MQTLFELPPARHAAGEPVRRGSRPKGREGLFWQGFDRRDVGRFMLAAERFERTGRQPGERNGPLGPVGLEVLRELLRFIDFRTGRLDPAIATIAGRIRRSRSAVVQALKALRDSGFLDWLRRYEPTHNEGKGPQVRQITNAYRLTLPPRALRLLGFLAEPAPAPADDQQRREDHQDARQTMVRELPRGEQVRELMTEGPLADAVARLGSLFRA